MKEENKLEILRDLLEGEANGGDGEEPGDVQEEGENNDREHVGEGEKLGGFVHDPFLNKK